MTGIIGAYPSKPPNSTCSPTPFPITGIIRTAVVFWLIIPIANSSAIIPEIVFADVNSTIYEIADIIINSGHTRLPLYEDNVDNILGVINAKDVLKVIKNNNAKRIKSKENNAQCKD